MGIGGEEETVSWEAVGIIVRDGGFSKLLFMTGKKR